MRGIPSVIRPAAAVGAVCMAALGGAGAQVALPPAVETAPLAKDAFATGMLTRADGALAPTLWRGADAKTLAFLLDRVPASPQGPALGEAMRRVLLSEGESPAGAEPSLGGRKLLALARAGFLDEARTIASLSNAPRNDPYVMRALATADLLAGDMASACQRNAALRAGRAADFWVKLRLLCYAASGERDAADLTLNLLREGGALDAADERLLPALVTGAAPKTPVAPRNALQLAALRQLGLALSPALLAEADGGVAAAAANDTTLDPATRVAAADRAAAMGVLTASELEVFYETMKVDVADLGRAVEISEARPDDPMTDVVLFQSVKQMTAPEFLRDKAARIALALSIADSFERAHAGAVLYSDDIVALEGALVDAREAARFSLARMAVGDGDGAARWLFAAIGGRGVDALDEDLAMTIIELVELLAVLDPISASAVAEAAKIDLGAQTRANAPGAGAADEGALARIVEAAFDAAIEAIPGQAGLAALAMSEAAAPGDAVAGAVIGQSLRAAGLNELCRRMEFERAWRARFSPANPGGEALMAIPASGEGARPSEGGLMPRLKPRSAP
ncbi:MAG: hypothetical protein AB7P23_11950 [Amphiplicatus sp.]